MIDWARDGRELRVKLISVGFQTMPVAFSAAPCLIMKASFYPIYRDRKSLKQYQTLRYSLRKQIHDEFKAMRFMEFTAQDVRTCKK